VQVLYSIQRDQYLGHTCDTLENRSSANNSNHKGFTGGVGDWKVVYFEEFENK